MTGEKQSRSLNVNILPALHNCHSVFKEGSVTEELAVVIVMSDNKKKKKIQRGFLQELNLDPYPAFTLPLRS